MSTTQKSHLKASINPNIAKGKWREIRGEVQKTWGKLTDDELDKTKGNVKAISGLIQQKYGKTQDEYSNKLTGIIDRFKEAKDDTMESVKKKIKK